MVPFQWMMSNNFEELGERFDLDVVASREPELDYKSTWIHEARNQTALLDGFSAHLRKDDSLCLFYAKHVPFVERTDRILVGAGRIKDIGPLAEYGRSGDGPRGMLWERPVQHSIRPNGDDGFLMPYQEILQVSADNPTIDLETYTAFAPSERWVEFSYGSELVTHDGAISALLSMESALGRIEDEFGIKTAKQRQWIHIELIRLWKVRGPYPGLGAILHAFGLSRGLFVAHALQQQAGENADPWPEVDKAFQDPTVLPAELRRDLQELASTWKNLPETRRSFVRLLSRFELDVAHVRCLYDESSRRSKGWPSTDLEILANPYRIFEVSRHDPDVIHLLTIDRGVFPDDAMRALHPLEEPSRLESGVDSRRLRAFAVAALEKATSEGHTMQFAGELANSIRASAVRPECPVTSDILRGSVTNLAPEIVAVETAGELALQLSRYRAISEIVSKNVRGRVAGKRHLVDDEWTKRLAEKFGPETDDEERRARKEKAESLAELAASRFSVLAGPAGAGKTSVLGILCAHKEVRRDGILLLAPTGKARVRMQQLAAGAGNQAMTIAQFLNRNGRYDAASGRYHLSDSPRVTGYGMVIVDEASMLTEDMLGALLDALQGVKRLILVGDPAQLPPIGAGRPFVDIIHELRPDDYEARFPRVAPGYAELTIERRQIGADRPDLRLARWFSASPPAPGEDDIFTASDEEHKTLRFIEWEKPEDFRARLVDALAEELKLDDDDDLRGFNRAMGATVVGPYDYFNATRHGKNGAVAEVEAWQILSPLRGMPFGVGDINRQIHERFRAGFLDLASRQWNRPIPTPFGAEWIVYGDKVINLRNHRPDGSRVYPQEGAVGYLANGEIGVAVGQWKTKRMKRAPRTLRVEFSSQEGYSYDFYRNDFGEEGDAALELAYALTVHKAQGSQFGLVILVLPEGHPILSRELIYTALTRHQGRVVVMLQGPRSLLKNLSAPHHSETARRRTNLLADCRMLEVPQAQGSVFLQEGLIHRTSKGLAVRSKSELLIAEAFGSAGVEFEYEKPLTLGGGTRYPDFTIEDEISGRTVYWEHLGMLARKDYRRGWEKKLAWYRANGVLPVGESNGGEAVLVTTTDSSVSGVDMSQVKLLISEVCGG
jgi:ATP-dependent exoDNAse (exonuclease V) alpha subunit